MSRWYNPLVENQDTEQLRDFDSLKFHQKLYIGARLFGLIIDENYRNLGISYMGSPEQREVADKQLHQRVDEFLVRKNIDPNSLDN